MRVVDSWIWHISISIGWRRVWLLWHKIGACSSRGISRRRTGYRLRLRSMLSLLRVMREDTIWNWWRGRRCVMSDMLVGRLILELRRHHLRFD
jgi:hypothetical protein